MELPNYTPRDHDGCIFCGKQTDHTFDECDSPKRILKQPTTLQEEINAKAWAIGMLIRSEPTSGIGWPD